MQRTFRAKDVSCTIHFARFIKTAVLLLSVYYFNAEHASCIYQIFGHLTNRRQIIIMISMALLFSKCSVRCLHIIGFLNCVLCPARD